MSTEYIRTPSVSVTATQPRDVDLGDGTHHVVETTVEVSISAPEHAAVLLNAAALGADQALRACDREHPATLVKPSEPAPISAQCGRTFLHSRHETEDGTCYGLDDTEAETASGATASRPAWDPIEVIIPRGVDPTSVKVNNVPDDGRGVIIRPDLTTGPELRPVNVYEVPAEALARVLENEATQPGEYGQGVRDVLAHLRLIPQGFDLPAGKRARR